MESSLTAKVNTGLVSLALLRHQCQGNGDIKVFHRANGAEGTADSIRPSRQRTRKQGSFAVAVTGGLSQSLLRGGEPCIIIRSWCATKIVLAFFLYGPTSPSESVPTLSRLGMYGRGHGRKLESKF